MVVRAGLRYDAFRSPSPRANVEVGKDGAIRHIMSGVSPRGDLKPHGSNLSAPKK
jgi:hypothetical protein